MCSWVTAQSHIEVQQYNDLFALGTSVALLKWCSRQTFAFLTLFTHLTRFLWKPTVQSLHVSLQQNWVRYRLCLRTASCLLRYYAAHRPGPWQLSNGKLTKYMNISNKAVSLCRKIKLLHRRRKHTLPGAQLPFAWTRRTKDSIFT